MKENAALSRILFFLSAMVVRGGCRADDLQPALLVGRTRLDGPALEGLARLEVVAQRNAEFSAVPLLGDIHPADESFAACADVLRAVDQVAHRACGGELVAEPFFDPRIEEVHRLHPAVAEVHAALKAVRQVDVELRGQREGGRSIREI